MARTTGDLFREDERARAEALLSERYQLWLQPDERFTLRIDQDGSHVLVTLTLSNRDESLHYPMEARFDPKGWELSERDAAERLLDFLDYYVGEYLKGDRDVFLTLLWSEIRFGEIQIEARGQEQNLKLERMADELLAKADAQDPSE
jgi:hypothetical protein